jgi:hypothetical protein
MQVEGGLRFEGMNTSPDSPELNPNTDPLSGETGAHPVSTGVGAAAIGAAGLVASAIVAGPVGLAVATVGGAVIGGYVGKAAGELIDPTVEEAYWREEHPKQPYARVRAEDDDYYIAYGIGYVGFSKHHGHQRSFEEAEPELRATYEDTGAKLPWEKARVATYSAWNRVHRVATGTPATSEAQHANHETLATEILQSGALSNAQMPR